MVNFWEWIVTECQRQHRKLEIELDGIIYDDNFNYNPSTNILTADSSMFPNESVGSDCNLLEKLSNANLIKITIQ